MALFFAYYVQSHIYGCLRSGLFYISINGFLRELPIFYCKWTVSCLEINRCGISGLNFINVICARFSYKRRFGSFFYVHVTKKAAKTTLVWKSRAYNVEEIDTWSTIVPYKIKIRSFLWTLFSGGRNHVCG